jgi:hypothetical protein
MDAGFARLTPRHSPELSTQSVERGFWTCNGLGDTENATAMPIARQTVYSPERAVWTGRAGRGRGAAMAGGDGWQLDGR